MATLAPLFGGLVVGYVAWMTSELLRAPVAAVLELRKKLLHIYHVQKSVDFLGDTYPLRRALTSYVKF